MARSKLVHKLFLGFLVGVVLGFIAFFAVNTFVVATNAIAVAAGATAPGPYDPPWAFPLAAFGFAFIVPVAGIISTDMDERQNETVNTSSVSVIEIGPQLAKLGQQLPEVIAMMKTAQQGQKKTEAGPPES
jgi:uncharacterized membrane protein